MCAPITSSAVTLDSIYNYIVTATNNGFAAIFNYRDLFIRSSNKVTCPFTVEAIDPTSGTVVANNAFFKVGNAQKFRVNKA